MSVFQEVDRVCKEADKIQELELLYMERGNVTPEEAHAWAVEKYHRSLDQDSKQRKAN